jgi:hypothetical protein
MLHIYKSNFKNNKDNNDNQKDNQILYFLCYFICYHLFYVIINNNVVLFVCKNFILIHKLFILFSKISIYKILIFLKIIY